MNLEFKIATIQFKFSNFHITEADIDELRLEIQKESPAVTAIIEQLLAKLAFDFVIRQQTYPYFEDVGYGFFKLVMDASVSTDVDFSPNCANVFNYLLKYFQMEIHQLKINITSEHSFIYDSLRAIIEDVSREAIMSMTDQLSEQIIESMNRGRDQYHESLFTTNTTSGAWHDMRLFQLANIYE